MIKNKAVIGPNYQKYESFPSAKTAPEAQAVGAASS
jgi:hypothetical protein